MVQFPLYFLKFPLYFPCAFGLMKINTKSNETLGSCYLYIYGNDIHPKNKKYLHLSHDSSKLAEPIKN